MKELTPIKSVRKQSLNCAGPAKEMSGEKKKQEYSTSNFYPACFLLAKGMRLIGIVRTTPRRCSFVFEDSPEREGLLHNFNFAGDNDPTVLVDSRRLIAAIKMLKEKLYQDR